MRTFETNTGFGIEYSPDVVFAACGKLVVIGFTTGSCLWIHDVISATVTSGRAFCIRHFVMLIKADGMISESFNTTNHQSPIINHQSSIINQQSSIINYQSSINNQRDKAFTCDPKLCPISCARVTSVTLLGTF